MRRSGLWIVLLACAVVVGVAAIAIVQVVRTALPPTAGDEDLGTVAVYQVNPDASLTPSAVGGADRVWSTFVRVVTPEEAGLVMAEYRAGESDSSDTLAYVYQSDDPSRWLLAANLTIADDPQLLVTTLVHEYAHILSLGVDQFQQTAVGCQTLDLAEGCATPTAYLYAFDERFWSAYGDDAPTPDDTEVDLRFYQPNSDDFVSDYASTNVVEDFAESFMTYVVEEEADPGTVIAEKLLFFGGYPELAAIRDRIRAEFDGEF